MNERVPSGLEVYESMTLLGTERTAAAFSIIHFFFLNQHKNH